MINRVNNTDVAHIKREIERISRRMRILQQLRHTTEANEAATEHNLEMAEAFEELGVSLEELESTSEALIRSNEDVQNLYNALDRERRRYRSLFESAPVGYLVTSLSGAILEANDAVAKLLNLKAEFLRGLPFGSLFAELSVADFQRRLLHLMQSDTKTQTWQERLQPRPGESIYVQLTVQEIQNEHGKPFEFRWIVTDLSQEAQERLSRENRARQEQALHELRTSLIRTISHEFRTPLTIILSATEMLRRYEAQLTQERRKGYLHKIQVQVTHLTNLISTVVLSARSEIGLLPYTPLQVDMDTLCQNCLYETGLVIDNSHPIEFQRSGDCSSAYLDAELIHLMLTNLLLHAVRYTAEGQTVRLLLKCEDGWGEFRVEHDAAQPLHDEPKPAAFQDMFPLRLHKDIAIGLTLVQRVTQLHGGSMKLLYKDKLVSGVVVRLPIAPRGQA